MSDYFDFILKTVQQAECLGTRVLADGTRLIGHTPHVAPEAYLHVLFRPLSRSELADLERKLGTDLPKYLREFLGRANGAMLFCYNLSLLGVRTSYARQGDEAWQPHDMASATEESSPVLEDNSMIVLGAYRWDGSLLVGSAARREVHRVDCDHGRALNRWPDFENMIVDEVMRLSELFDHAGRQIEPATPTTPPNDLV
jgi:hypothetical protein